MLWCIVLFGYAVTVIALYQYYSGGGFDLGYRMSGGMSGISANPNDFALTINIIIPFAVAFFMISKSTTQKVFIASFLAFGVLGILVTYSRAGFITLLAALFLAVYKGAAPNRKMSVIIPVVLIALVLVVLAPKGYQERMLTTFDPEKEASAQNRQTSALRTLELIVQYPIFGVGMGMNVLALNETGMFWAHVHNIYLQIASELGILALIVFLMLIWRLIKGLRWVQARLKDDPRHADFYLLAVACEISLLCLLLAAMFYPIAYYFYFYYVAGFSLALQGIVAKFNDKIQPAPKPRFPWQVGQQQPLPWERR
jgi:O-antigen ligase